MNNLEWKPNIRSVDGKEQILCEWRHKWVRLTPEEWVRQNVLHRLVEDAGYPMTLIAVEHPIQVAQTSKRCDAVVMDGQLLPVCIVEFKADDVSLTQKVFDQVAVYNRAVRVRYFIISNGITTYACKLNNKSYDFLETLPSYTQLCQKE